MSAEELKKLILQFIASLCLCDHMGDVADDINAVLERLGIEVQWDDLRDLAKWCGRQNITTLYGTSLKDDSEEEEDE